MIILYIFDYKLIRTVLCYNPLPCTPHPSPYLHRIFHLVAKQGVIKYIVDGVYVVEG